MNAVKVGAVVFGRGGRQGGTAERLGGSVDLHDGRAEWATAKFNSCLDSFVSADPAPSCSKRVVFGKNCGKLTQIVSSRPIFFKHVCHMYRLLGHLYKTCSDKRGRSRLLHMIVSCWLGKIITQRKKKLLAKKSVMTRMNLWNSLIYLHNL